jgi:hypothetical protein
MKRLFLLAVILMTGMVAQAAPKSPSTLDEYLAKKKASAEKKGETFDEAKAKAKFAQQDLNKDGTLSVEEQTPAPKADKAPAK